MSEQMQLKLDLGGIGNLKLPDPDLMLFYQEKEKRHFWLEEEISEDTCSYLIRVIQQLNRDESDDLTPITLHISSPGGALSVMFVLYETILNSKIPVHTINEGGAHSAAFIIFLAGHRRSMNRFAYFVAHEGGIGTNFTSYRENKQANKQYEKDVLNMKEIISERTAISLELLEEKFEREQDWYIDFEIAKELNVITE